MTGMSKPHTKFLLADNSSNIVYNLKNSHVFHFYISLVIFRIRKISIGVYKLFFPLYEYGKHIFPHNNRMKNSGTRYFCFINSSAYYLLLNPEQL